MNRFVTISLLLIGCAPTTALSPELFRGEYNAIEESAGHTLSVRLGDIEFLETDWESLQFRCKTTPCVASASGNTIRITKPPENHCDKPQGTDEAAASVYIHEMLHVMGYSHGALQDAATSAAWVIYYNDWCRGPRSEE